MDQVKSTRFLGICLSHLRRNGIRACAAKFRAETARRSDRGFTFPYPGTCASWIKLRGFCPPFRTACCRETRHRENALLVRQSLSQLTQGFKQTAAWAAFGGSSRGFSGESVFYFFCLALRAARRLHAAEVSSVRAAVPKIDGLAKGAKLRFDIEKSGGSELAETHLTRRALPCRGQCQIRSSDHVRTDRFFSV